MAVPALAPAFERDSHYYLRFGLSLATCFNWEESHLIASGDWGMDENRQTHAENPKLREQKPPEHLSTLRVEPVHQPDCRTVERARDVP